MSSTAITPPVWHRSTLAIALMGSLLLWAALPPLAFGWLGWIAPIPWLLLVSAEKMPGRRPYRALYVAGFWFWLMAIHWLRLPHPLTSIGWVALSAYLAVYLPLFVGLSRVAVHRLSAPLWLAAPVVFTGLELARAHMLTGFLMGSLAHSQVDWTTVIQISDLVGEYGVDFLVVLVAACATDALLLINTNNVGRSLVAITPAAIALAATFIYGNVRLSQAELVDSTASKPGLRIALIQGNSLAEWKLDPNREQQIMKQYTGLSERAVAASQKKNDGRSVDLVVWPETMYRSPLRDFGSGFNLPAKITSTTDEIADSDHRQLANLAAHLGAAILVGVDRFHYVADEKSNSEQPTMQFFNSSVLVTREGKIVGTYDKMHRVMFGEYIPFADWIPFLYKVTPLTGGIVAGAESVALKVNSQFSVAPNICYETAIPHVIRRQVSTLDNRGEPPVALVNLTNDAWYWGSSELDMHLACDVFRAVETRMPLIVAANGGISASIGRDGRIRARLGKQEADFLLAEIEPGFMSSWYVRCGDWFSGVCLACCIGLSIVEWRTRRALRNRVVAASPTV